MSGVTLAKGGVLSLSKQSDNLSTIIVGLGWDERSGDGPPYDLDATIFVLGPNGKVPSDEWIIFYNQEVSPDGSVKHSGDNLTGDGDGDDESIIVKLQSLPAEAEQIVIAATIHKAEQRGQTFGMVRNAYVRVCDFQNDREGDVLARFDLHEDASVESAMIFAVISREEGAWNLQAIGHGRDGGLAALCSDYGVNVNG